MKMFGWLEDNSKPPLPTVVFDQYCSLNCADAIIISKIVTIESGAEPLLIPPPRLP